MTNKEAQGWIEDIPHDGFYSMEIMAIEIASKALEKQIPKKPITNDVGGAVEFICPNCEYDYVAYGGRTYMYCPSCGQAIDWSEVT